MQALYPWNAFSSIPSPRHLNTTSWPFGQRISHHGDFGKQMNHSVKLSTVVYYTVVYLKHQYREIHIKRPRLMKVDSFLPHRVENAEAVLRNLWCSSLSCPSWRGQLFNELNKVSEHPRPLRGLFAEHIALSSFQAQSRCEHYVAITKRERICDKQISTMIM